VTAESTATQTAPQIFYRAGQPAVNAAGPGGHSGRVLRVGGAARARARVDPRGVMTGRVNCGLRLLQSPLHGVSQQSTDGQPIRAGCQPEKSYIINPDSQAANDSIQPRPVEVPRPRLPVRPFNPKEFKIVALREYLAPTENADRRAAFQRVSPKSSPIEHWESSERVLEEHWRSSEKSLNSPLKSAFLRA